MHQCPICDEVCHCDLEDHFQRAPADCQHDCDVEYDDEGEFYDCDDAIE